MYLVYNALLVLWLLITSPYWLIQMGRHGKYRAGLRERFGKIPDRLRINSSQSTVWVHAVSVGEVLAVSELVHQLRSRRPDIRIVVSTTTDTGQKLARKRFGDEHVFYFPLDLTFAVRHYIDAVRPQLVLIAETEFWPNFLRLAKASGARIAIVNARISDRSFPGYRRISFLIRRVLTYVDLFLTQTEQDRARLIAIGALPDRIQVAGNLKFDVDPPPAPPVVAGLRKAFDESNATPILVCGSTVEGEERLLMQAFQNVLASHPRAVMLLAPRHPERFAPVATLLESLGGRFWRRSLWNGEPISGGVMLVDSIGELAALYAVADIAFVGGSLVPRGGHNIIEPAQYGVPIVVGNHTENFRDIVGLFQGRQAVLIVGPAELPLVFLELIADPAERKDLGQRAAETLHSQRGATHRTLEALERLLPRAYAVPASRSAGEAASS
jgi:3-deoxy-D-manno-octulosonic-acid transferase